MKCDFCGKEVDTVRRVAIDESYDRLTVKHEIKYACEECSVKKEQERQEEKDKAKAPSNV